MCSSKYGHRQRPPHTRPLSHPPVTSCLLYSLLLDVFIIAVHLSRCSADTRRLYALDVTTRVFFSLYCFLVFRLYIHRCALLFIFFFLNNPAPPEISPLPLPDPLPIYRHRRHDRERRVRAGHHGAPAGCACPRAALPAVRAAGRRGVVRSSGDRADRTPISRAAAEIGRAHV